MALGEYDKELLTITMEECAEVIQACSKIIRFGETPTNLTALEKEIGDLYCMIDLIHENDYISYTRIDDYVSAKREKLKVYSNLFALD
jgi:NTP pyrophosphatase (non-canonical NTP hydrolase)